MVNQSSPALPSSRSQTYLRSSYLLPWVATRLQLTHQTARGSVCDHVLSLPVSSGLSPGRTRGMGQGPLHEPLALVCCLKRRERLESESLSPGLVWLLVTLRSVTHIQRACYGALTAMRTVDEFSSQGLLVNECMMRGKKRHEGTDG